MPKLFTFNDVRNLIKKHIQLKNYLFKTQNINEYYIDEIKKYAENIIYNKALEILKEIPIDEINREKQGFRIKTLRENGFNSIADLVSSKVARISDIYGISEDTAYQLKNISNNILKQVKDTIKIKITEDNKSYDYSNLILNILKYTESSPYIELCQKLIDDNLSNIDCALNNIIPAKSFFRWLFTSRSKKTLAENRYLILNEYLNNGYLFEVEKLLETLEKIYNYNEKYAWEKFSDNPISFITILEELIPEYVGETNSLYGLNETLVKEIENENIYFDGLKCKLRSYQTLGVKYILHQRSVLLGDEMGLGKTVQAIATMVSLKNIGENYFMVVCPASVLTNWCREISKHSSLNVFKVHGVDKLNILEDWKKYSGVAVTTYETTSIFKLDNKFKISLLIVDEAHYIKNKKTKRATNIIRLSKNADRLLFMTGTPIENNVDEMISLISILNYKLAKELENMKSLRFAPEFREKISSIYYRRRREDVLKELPDLIESLEWCEMTDEEELVYENSILDGNYSYARRVSWNIENLETSSKANRMLEIINEAAEDKRKVIIFSFFLDTIQKIKTLLGDKCVEPIQGSVSPERRQKIIDEFNNSPNGTVLLCQIQSGGTGLNIQSASVVIICEPQFKPSIEKQAISRAYRMGQTRNVFVYRLLCENTIDEKILAKLEEKQNIFDTFAGESVASIENNDIDDITFNKIMNEEYIRINNKRNNI